tara:strand:+ start:235 stop:474 length:240 start_codon:yes stop_codon:yes gene_type:complete
MERAEAVGAAITKMVEAFNGITEDEILALIEEGQHKHSMDPFVDPTRYRMEGPGITQGIAVLRAMLVFKEAVKGIGYFR